MWMDKNVPSQKVTNWISLIENNIILSLYVKLKIYLGMGLPVLYLDISLGKQNIQN